MERTKYWNEEYTKYWKNLTQEANDKEDDKTKVKKLKDGDYKTIGQDTAYLLFDEMAYKKDEILLDYGCGFGRFYSYFNSRAHYYGIDISESMISECKKSYPNAQDRFIVSEGENLPFDKNYFDKIICFGVFDACYQENALQEMLRVTAEGGIILLTGKNYNYNIDDEQAYIAEEAARKKGHPNYFTDVASLIKQIKGSASIELERYFLYRGDFGKNKYVTDMPAKFYEFAIIIKKIRDDKVELKKFSDEYSLTWREKNSADIGENN